MQWQMAKLSSRPATEKVIRLHRQVPVRICSASDMERCCCGYRWETENNGSIEDVESKFQIPEEWEVLRAASSVAYVQSDPYFAITDPRERSET